jgi:hypothetical protein
MAPASTAAHEESRSSNGVASGSDATLEPVVLAGKFALSFAAPNLERPETVPPRDGDSGRSGS